LNRSAITKRNRALGDMIWNKAVFSRDNYDAAPAVLQSLSIDLWDNVRKSIIMGIMDNLQGVRIK